MALLAFGPRQRKAVKYMGVEEAEQEPKKKQAKKKAVKSGGVQDEGMLVFVVPKSKKS